MRQKLLTTLALLLMAVSGAWAQDPAWLQSGDEWDLDTKTLTVNSDPGDSYNTNTVIEHLIIDTGVTSISAGAFSGCTSLNSIFIGGDVQTIGDDAFASVPQNAKVYVLPYTPPTLGNNAFGSNSVSFYVHGNEYSSDDDWKDFSNVSIIFGIYFGTDITANVSPILSYNGYDYYEVGATLTLNGGTNYVVIKDENTIDVTASVLNGSELTMPAYNIIVGQVITGCCGKSGDNVTWEYNSATCVLTISGTGAMADYDNGLSPSPWYDFRYENPDIIIGEGVTNIGNYAFKGFYMSSITIPASVTSIGNHAFDSCEGLESLYVLATTCSLGSDAFADCTELKEIYVANEPYYTANWTVDSSVEIKALSSWTSGDCTVTFAGTILIVEKTNPSSATGAMEDYSDSDDREWDDPNNTYTDQITSIIIKDGVTHIGDWAFSYCYYVQSVTIPTSVESIGANAFCNCSSLTSISIPASVTTIGDYAFSDCTELTSITFAEGLTTIHDHTFTNCSSLASITIPSTVTGIGAGAFENCSNLTSVTILATSLTTYGENSFLNTATGLRIYVPAASVDTYKTNWSLYEDNFVGSYTVTFGQLPNGVTGVATPSMAADGETVTISFSGVPAGKVPGLSITYGNNYEVFEVKDNGDGTFSFPMPNDNVTVSGSDLKDDIKLFTPTVPDQTMERFGGGNDYPYIYFKFEDAINNPTSNVIDETVTDGNTTLTLGTDYTFGSVSYANGNSGDPCNIGDECIVEIKGMGNYGGSLYASFTIVSPSANSTWGDLSWSLSNGTLTISGDGPMVTPQGNGSYPWLTYKSHINTITIGDGVTSVADGAFATEFNDYHYTVSTVNLPTTSLTTIGANAFAYCEGANITIPASVTSVGETAFYNVAKVTSTLSDANDNTTFIARLFEAKTADISYTRSFTKDANSTVCLPFSLSSEQASAAGKFYEFVGVDKSNPEDWVVTMQDANLTANDPLTANKPYLFKPAATGNLTFTGTTDRTAVTPVDQTADTSIYPNAAGWTFKGTYARINWTDDPQTVYGFAAPGHGTMSEGKFFRVKGGTNSYITPFRAYLQYVDPSSARGVTRGAGETLPETMTIRFISAAGATTAIGTLNTRTGEISYDGWYTLDGHRLAGKPSTKGMYINNGKKVVIK